MRILFLAPAYAGLHIPIIEEMKRQGHDVVWIDDTAIQYDMRIPRHGILNKMRCKVSTVLRHPSKKVWDKIFKERSEELKTTFDMFFCINGRTLCKELFVFLDKMPNIKKVLYVWDSVSVFDFYRYQDRFHKCYTFDLDDSVNVSGLVYKPLYWIDNHQIITFDYGSAEKKRYDISIVGSDHDKRFEIVNKILPQVKDAGLSYFFRVQIWKPSFSHVFLYKFRMRYMASFRRIVEYAEAKYERDRKNEIAMEGVIPPAEYTEIMRHTVCVLDTDRGTQSGITPRVIWALAMGKKIISTNRNLLRAPFYSSEQISIIDRETPIIDIDFIKDNRTFSIHPEIEKLRLDKWVRNFMEG
ncbi:hypothetical protein AAAU12_08295 [Bacteroides zhangwenhongii]|jgi:hypothetical protein|uniref:hypothetical protein n=1 Tax=Bacteroides zhangwenhongii TaxID=2650157 RepID=UPI0032C0C3EE